KVKNQGLVFMKLSDAPTTLKQLRKTPWKFQQTFKTPLEKLEPFVAAIVSLGLPKTASVTIQQAVFEPKHWINLLTHHSLPAKYGKGMGLIATGESEIQELLRAAFSDPVDFIFVPSPKRFVIYADHDEFTTFYANTTSQTNRIAEGLSTLGVKRVPEYT